MSSVSQLALALQDPALDSIALNPGSYTLDAPLRFNRSVVLQAVPETVVLTFNPRRALSSAGEDSQAFGILAVTSGVVTLSGMNITGRGRGLVVQGGPATLVRVSRTHFYGLDGGGAGIHGGEVEFTNCTFHGNTADA